MSELSTRTSLHKRMSNFSIWIKPDPDTRENVRNRANNIRKNISRQAEADGLIILSTPEAGSWANHTGLRRHFRGNSEVDGQDVDVPFVLGYASVLEKGEGNLLNLFEKYAKASYPDAEIKKTKSSVKIKFSDNTYFDLVPMIGTDEKEEQIIFRSNGEKVKTSVQRHNEFIRSRTVKSKAEKGRVKFNECVRFMKWWKEFQTSESIHLDRDEAADIDNSPPSFLLNLLCAKAYDQLSVEETYAETLAKWCGYLASLVRRRSPILFQDYNEPVTDLLSAWTVVDPVNENNNIVKNWTENQLIEFAEWFEEARDEWSRVIRYDEDGEDNKSLDALVKLFGNPFRNHCD